MKREEHCTDPDDVSCSPMYGLAPHIHTNKGVELTGEVIDGFTPDPDEPGMGVYWCPMCGEAIRGKQP